MRHASYLANLEAAKVFEDFVYDQMYRIGVCIVRYGTVHYQCGVGENRAGLEIKLDRKFRQTENLFIELAEKSHESNAEWKPAGCLAQDNSWWYAIGDYQGFYLFGKQLLSRLHERKGAIGEDHYAHVETKTAKGFLLPIADADRYADKHVIPDPATVPDSVRMEAA